MPVFELDLVPCTRYQFLCSILQSRSLPSTLILIFNSDSYPEFLILDLDLFPRSRPSFSSMIPIPILDLVISILDFDPQFRFLLVILILNSDHTHSRS
jgi:hypothetical protein